MRLFLIYEEIQSYQKKQLTWALYGFSEDHRMIDLFFRQRKRYKYRMRIISGRGIDIMKEEGKLDARLSMNLCFFDSVGEDRYSIVTTFAEMIEISRAIHNNIYERSGMPNSEYREEVVKLCGRIKGRYRKSIDALHLWPAEYVFMGDVVGEGNSYSYEIHTILDSTYEDIHDDEIVLGPWKRMPCQDLMPTAFLRSIYTIENVCESMQHVLKI